MASSPELTRLHDVLAELYPAESVARVVADEAGLSAQTVHLTGSADEIWGRILSAAQTDQQIHNVIDVALRHFPENASLLEAMQALDRSSNTTFDQRHQTVRNQVNIASATFITPNGSDIDQENLSQQSIKKNRSFEPDTVFIPGDQYLMGSAETDAPEWEKPQHYVKLSGFRIGKCPVQNWEYLAYLESQGILANREMGWDGQHPPSDKENHPVTGVSWYDALAYCRWLSEQTDRHYTLPTEAQWEATARGPDGHTYPWGDDPPTADRCNFENHVGDTTPVGRYSPQGDSLYDAADMAGNVREWTTTLWGETGAFEPDTNYRYPPQTNDGRNNLNANSAIRRVFRSGGAADGAERMRAAARGGYEPNASGPYEKRHGFRVVLVVETDRRNTTPRND